MSQPSHPDWRSDPDPLSEFEQEIVANVPEVPAPSALPPPEAPAPPPPEPDRLAVAEEAIVKLRSEVATLVNVVEDIRKRLNKRIDSRPQPVARPSGTFLQSTGAAVVVLLGVLLGAATWRALTTADVPEAAPPIAALPEPEQAPSPPPMASPPPAAAPIPASAVMAREQPAPHQPVRDVVRRAYVGSLSIDAQPAGDVFLNRKRAGRTPLRLDNLRAGSHLVWIERDGYRRWTRVVQVPADRISRVSAELETIAR
jgi:hypothetical protein